MEFFRLAATTAARRHQSAIADAALAARAVAQAQPRKLGGRANLQSCGGAARSQSHRWLRLRLYGLGFGGFRSRGAAPACRRAAQRRPVRDRRVAFVAPAERPLAICRQPGAARRSHRRQPPSRLARSLRAKRRCRACARQCFGGAMMKPLRLPENPRVLVVALRRLGDVLLTTPLIRSVKRAFPHAAIDALVFTGTEGILTGNPDLAKIITLTQQPRAGETLALMLRLCKRYDLALSTQTGDRPTFLAIVAGRQSAGPVEADGVTAAVKRFALGRCTVSGHSQHRVLDLLRLAELIGVPAHSEIVCPGGGVRSALAPPQPYAVIHAAPMFTYKRWTS